MIECTIVIEDRESRVQVAAVVLAAGGSARMGQPKQLLAIDGQPMVRRVARAVCEAGLDQVVVVTGAHAGEVGRALAGLPVQLAHNRDWQEGMSTSLREGLDALRPEIQAALIVLADQPALTARLLGSLVAHYRATGAPIVAPVLQGKRGNPVLFDRELFDELLAVEGDQGGRAVLTRHAAQVEPVKVDDPAVFFDVDTLQDYAEAQEPGRRR
jgi:molybdenum cofactor cytidylyltransferase